MSASDETSPRSASAAAAAARPERRAAAASSSRPARSFRLSGPSVALDPSVNAYRADLADIRLAGRILAPHYARALPRTTAHEIELKLSPRDDAEIVAKLSAGEAFAVLEYAGGWAWGYVEADQRVGYLPAAALAE